MQNRTYTELIEFLEQELQGWDIVLGSSKNSIDKPTCFINHYTSTTTSADGVAIISSSTFDLVFLQDRAAFTNARIIEILEDGIKFAAYDDATGKHVFTGSVTLYGPGSLPDE